MMLNLRARKILRDLWGSKTRTALVVLTIALGVLGVSSIARAWVILSRNLTENYTAVNPASASISTLRPFDDAVVDLIRSMPEVQEAEGRNGEIVRIRVGPDQWRVLRLIVRADYNNINLNEIRVEQGAWPPPEQTMLIERSSLNLTRLDTGDTAVIQLPNGKMQELAVSGIVHDLTQTPTVFSYVGYGYITAETLEQLNGARGYKSLDITVAEKPLDEAHIQHVVELVTDKLEANRLIVTEKSIPEPGKHQLDNIIQSVLILLGILAVLALFLSAFLVINIISALLAQQVQQIGAIKAVGGRSTTIAAMYFGAIFVLSLLALLIAVPAGMLMARANSVFIAGLINFDITSFSIPIQIYGLEIFAGLIVPLLAGLYPIISGTRITVREAVSQAGSNTSFGTGGIEKLLNLLRGLPMGLLYALRNIFRRKVRLALALLTLSIAGAIFIAVISVQASLLITIDEIAEYWQEDISLRFYNAHRFNKLERQALTVPGIAGVEGRLVKRGFRVRPDDTESKQTFTFYGVPVPTDFLQPVVLEGRWLRPDDENSIVLNVDLLSLEPDISVGDEVEFRIEDRKITWQVVGIVTSQVIGSGELLMSPIAYANYPYMAKAMGETGQADQILLRTEQHDGSYRAGVGRELEKYFGQANLRIAAKLINNDVRAALESAFDIVLSLVQLMSLLFAVVGGLGLMSMMSLNVLERTQEIGIIRVVGGIRKVIAQIVVAEGIFVGVLSWAIGAMLAFPLSKYLCHILGLTLLNVPLTHTFPINGLLLWLVFVIILAAIASILPARNASRLSVRETLTYE